MSNSSDEFIYRYKYLPFNEGSLQVIESGTIKFTCPLDFNDPFDCIPWYEVGDVRKLRKTRPAVAQAVAEELSMSPAQRIKASGKWKANLDRLLKNGQFSNLLLKDVGVVSLTRNPLSIPMWSHYADHHRGFVVEFKIPIRGPGHQVELWTRKLVPLEVQYDVERPKLVLADGNPTDLLERVVLTKSLDWAYEEEERVIDHVRGPGIHEYYRDEILSSVIAGLKMSNDDYARLRDSVSNLSNPNVKLYLAERDPKKYSICVESHPRISSA